MFWINVDKDEYPVARAILDVFEHARGNIAIIRDTKTGENFHLVRYTRNGMPYLLEYPAIRCGYYESRLDLFVFACERARIDYLSALWIDGASLEILDYHELCDEYADMCEESEEL